VIVCSGKNAFVTGAGAGIGRACAIALAKAGAHVIVSDIDGGSATETAEMIASNGGSARAEQQDVCIEERWNDIFAGIQSRDGGLDIMVNNAGIAVGAPVTEMTLDEWRGQMAVNLDGVFMGTKGAILLMAEKGTGSIINISSIAGLVGSPGLSGYCASKGGVRLFTKAVALEMAEAGLAIRANSVHPGIIDTEIWEKQIANVALMNPELAEPGANQISVETVTAGLVPGGKTGQPQDIANAVVFLASDASSYMTGSEMVIDHGVTAK
jgi:NAD(P)-dependent dehydrogenase (short-subunit alcohol dehydrogenase family)